jgi:hypothetical protein
MATPFLRALSNNALKLTKRVILVVGALRAPSSLSRASQLSAVFDGPFVSEVIRPKQSA